MALWTWRRILDERLVVSCRAHPFDSWGAYQRLQLRHERLVLGLPGSMSRKRRWERDRLRDCLSGKRYR